MLKYISQQPEGPIRSVAFEQTREGQFCFITTTDETAAQHLKSRLASSPTQPQILSSTETDDGRLLIVRAKNAPQEILKLLAEDGQSFAPPVPEKKFNPWAWRGVTSIIGQSGQLLSAFQRYDYAKKSTTITAAELSDVTGNSAGVAGFAVLNLVANVINIKFGAQEKNDPHQLVLLKQQFNDHLHARYGEQAIVDAPDATVLVNEKQKIGSFLDRHSVSFGEIFLRTLGSASLAFPVTRVLPAVEAFRAEGMAAGFQAAKNKDPVTFIYGLAMLAGKFTSFAASEPDPYNPKPPSALRIFREKVAFKLSSVIEGAGAAYSAVDCYRNPKKKIHMGTKEIPDIPGAIGNAVFVGGYGIRYTAPYGTREVYMPELYAHVSNAIAQLPAEQQPEATATAAQWMAGHFADKKQEAYRLPVIYATLAKELEKHPTTKIAETAPSLALQTRLPEAPSTTIAGVQSRAMLQAVPDREAALA